MSRMFIFTDALIVLFIVAGAILFLRVILKDKASGRIEIDDSIQTDCDQCGHPNPTHANYCGKCGKPLK